MVLMIVRKQHPPSKATRTSSLFLTKISQEASEGYSIHSH